MVDNVENSSYICFPTNDNSSNGRRIVYYLSSAYRALNKRTPRLVQEKSTLWHSNIDRVDDNEVKTEF